MTHWSRRSRACCPLVRCQISQLSTVPKASSPRSARARAPSTWSRIQLHLGRGEIRIQHQPGLRGNRLAGSALLELLAERRCAPVLPHDRGMNRLARRALPHNHRLALVGNADGGHVARPRTYLAPELPRRSSSGWTEFPPDRAPPTPPADRTAGTLSAPPPLSCQPRQTESPANSSSPGPAPIRMPYVPYPFPETSQTREAGKGQGAAI